MRSKKNLIKLFVIFLAFSLFISAAHVVVEEFYFGHSAEKVALENAIGKAKERESVFKQYISQAENTLISIRELHSFNIYLNDASKEVDLKDIFLGILRSHSDFMSLRYIDRDGFEKIRINRDTQNSRSYAVPQTQLQNKSQRYYFINSKSKPLEEVWFSDLDLNVEKEEVKIPYQPTLRAILPIRNNGKFDGILIVNFLMEEFLAKLFNAPLYDMILCDKEGYSLKHYDTQKSWGKYGEKQYNISEEFPEDYKEILSAPMLSTDFFVSKQLELHHSFKNNLFIIFKLRKSYLDEQDKNTFEKYVFVTILTFVLAFFTSILIVGILSQLIRTYERKLIELSHTDDLTQLENRKSYNERIEEMIAGYNRYQTVFSVVMLDIDFFKSINDTYGHSMGDNVLVDLSYLLKTSIRANDHAYRIGGEEFIILLSNANIAEATRFAEKLRSKIEKELITIKNRTITISLGVTEVKPDDTANSLYDRADASLYAAKENGRNKVVSNEDINKNRMG